MTFPSHRLFHLHGLSVVLLVCATTVALVWPIDPATALPWWLNPKDITLYLISWAFYLVYIKTIGFLATFMTDVLVWTAQFNNFTDLPVIKEAWTTVRDLANMFFIVILLVIAFGTLFNLEAYSWKKLLPKMVLAAILINYSRAITGFFVDASQVVMLTFVAAIKDAAQVGLVEAFSLNKLLQFGTTTTPSMEEGDAASTVATERLLALIVAGVMLATMFTVQLVYVVVLVGRLVMIWFLTVLSPLAYASNVLPQTEKYSSQWWEMFGRYVTVGPLIMFFLWLSMFIAARSIENGGLGSAPASPEIVSQELQNKKELGAAGFDTSLIAGFIIATMMLSAGMKLAQDNASELGDYTSKASNLGKWVTRTAPAFLARAAAGTAADRLYERTGLDLNVQRQFQKIKHKREEIKRKREAQGYGLAFQAAQRGNFLKGWLGAADFAYEQYTPVLGRQGMLLGKHPQKKMLWRAFANVTYKKKVKELEEAEREQMAREEKMKERKRQLGEQYMMVGDRETKLAGTNNALGTVNALSANGEQWNMAADSESRGIAESLRRDLIKERSETKDVGTAERLQKQIEALDQALKEKGTVDINLVGNLGTRLGRAKSDRLRTLRDERDKLRGISVTNDKGEALVDQVAYNKLIEEQTKKERDAVGKAKRKVDNLKTEVLEYGPVVDYEATQAQEAVLAEERKKYAGESNEDVLKELLKSKLHEGDGMAVLGIISHSATVGHLNEMMDALNISQSVEGLQELAAMIENLGVDRQMVLASLNEASKSAKGINHWAFAEVITQRNGKYQWRTPEERNKRLYVEATKAGMNNIARNSNRLGLGYYKYNTETGQQEWQPEPAMMQLLAQTLPKLKDSANKGLLNNNMGEHLFFKYDGKYGDYMKKLVTEMYGAGSDQEREAFETMEIWKQYTSRKGGEADDYYKLAEKVLKDKGVTPQTIKPGA